MANGCDAFFRPLSATWAKRIGGDIDVVATMLVLIGEPRHIPRLQRLLQSDDSLQGSSCILPAKQDGYRLIRGKTTSEKAGGNLTHNGTSCECEPAGL